MIVMLVFLTAHRFAVLQYGFIIMVSDPDALSLRNRALGEECPSFFLTTSVRDVKLTTCLNRHKVGL
jgi:hypothetical protein